MAKTPRKPAAKKSVAKRATPKKAATSSAGLETATTAKGAVKTSSAAPKPVAKPVLEKTLSKNDLLDRLVEQTGEKRPVVKKIMEATLSEVGDGIQRGDVLNLPPLGKLSVNRSKEVDAAHVFITKLRRAKKMLAGRAIKSPVAKAVMPAPKSDIPPAPNTSAGRAAAAPKKAE